MKEVIVFICLTILLGLSGTASGAEAAKNDSGSLDLQSILSVVFVLGFIIVLEILTHKYMKSRKNKRK